VIDAADAGLRAGLVALGLGAWYGSQRLLGRRPAKPADRPADPVHRLTAGLHARLAARPRAADAVLIGSSALVDLFGLALVASALLGPSFRPFLALGMLFALRQACQAAIALPAPPGMIWRSPGVPSLLVTYDVGNDFFFSGHTGLAVLGAIEAWTSGPPWLGAAAAAIAALQAATVLVLRAHWTVDVVAAIPAAFACHALAALAAPAVDGWLSSGF
jgi:hypothetical protein